MEAFSGNWVDLIFFALLIYFALTNNGFVRTLIEVLGFLFSLALSYKLYPFFSKFFLIYFSIPRGFSYVLGFFSVWFIAELVFFFIVYRLLKNYLARITKNPADILFGFLMGALQAMIIFLFFISLVFALPVRGQIKKDVLDSRTGPFFVNLSQKFEVGLKQIFGQAANETLNFLTVNPESTSSLDLGLKLHQEKIVYDVVSEKVMFDLINQERQKTGVKQAVFAVPLQSVARKYAAEMFVNGFFSHTSQVDGSDAAERVQTAGISYGVLGENLAFAPDVYIAHQGLINSEGHKKNILSADYSKVGIGIVDGGIYGKMFVQLFSD